MIKWMGFNLYNNGLLAHAIRYQMGKKKHKLFVMFEREFYME